MHQASLQPLEHRLTPRFSLAMMSSSRLGRGTFSVYQRGEDIEVLLFSTHGWFLSHPEWKAFLQLCGNCQPCCVGRRFSIWHSVTKSEENRPQFTTGLKRTADVFVGPHVIVDEAAPTATGLIPSVLGAAFTAGFSDQRCPFAWRLFFWRSSFLLTKPRCNDSLFIGLPTCLIVCRAFGPS